MTLNCSGIDDVNERCCRESSELSASPVPDCIDDVNERCCRESSELSASPVPDCWDDGLDDEEPQKPPSKRLFQTSCDKKHIQTYNIN